MTDIATQLNNTIGLGTSNGSSSTKSSSSSTSSSDSSKDAASLMGTTDQFLNLLLAQLKYQDPTQPMKGTEFIDSISRLSGVEQSINTNKHLENIASLLGGNNQTGTAVSYIDKNVSYNTSQIALKNHLTGFSYDLPTSNTPTGVTMTITDANGNVIVNVQGTNKAGVNNVKWDGTDSNGNTVADGLYKVSVQYPDPSNANSSISVATYTTGVVTGADFTGTTPMLNIDGVEVPISAIKSINSNSTTAAN